jgi:hypothetical protein
MKDNVEYDGAFRSGNYSVPLFFAGPCVRRKKVIEAVIGMGVQNRRMNVEEDTVSREENDVRSLSIYLKTWIEGS